MKNKNINVLRATSNERRATNSGFTFLEVMISLLLLMIGIIFLIDLFPIALKNFQRAKDVTKASFLVQQKMEEIRALPFNQSAPCVSKSPDPSDPNFKYTIGERSWPFEDSEDYKEVKVRVDNIVSAAYAEASTTKRQSPKGDMEVLQISEGTGADYYIFVFVIDRATKLVYYNDTRYNVSSGYYADSQPVNRIWRAIPSPAGVWMPDKIKVVSMVQSNSYGWPIHWRPFYIYVTDTQNNCVWANVLEPSSLPGGNNTYGFQINLSTARSWVKIKGSLPQ